MPRGPHPLLILGLGNDLAGDDAVGPIAARRLHDSLPPGTADLLEAAAGMHHVVDLVLGYERVILIDAVAGQEPGLVRTVALEELGGSSTSHGAGLAEALADARQLGATLPAQIAVYGVGAEDAHRLGQGLSRSLAARLDSIVELILEREFPELL